MYIYYYDQIENKDTSLLAKSGLMKSRETKLTDLRAIKL